MKKNVILLLIGVALSAGTMAQTKVIKAEEKNLENSIKEKKEDRHEAGKDLKNFRIKSSLKGRKEVRRDRRSIHRQGAHLKKHGIKHPIENAKKEAKIDKDIKNANN